MSYERLLHLKRSNINQDEKDGEKERKKPSVLLERIRNPNTLTIFNTIFRDFHFFLSYNERRSFE